ncbi:MAG: nuclease-related domain-containing protein, partial [Halodesulfurarchaeum sp.]
MAKMIPPRPPRRGDGTTGSEVDLWKALQEQLPEGFVVYHSLPYLRSDSVQGEVDFLIVHREHGMLVLECKGGGIFRDEDGVWLRKNPNGTRDRIESPSDQARDQVETVVDKTRGPLQGLLERSFGKYPLVYGWALAFPYTHVDEIGLPIDFEPEVVVGSQHMGQLHEKIVGALEFYGQKVSNRSMSEEEFEDFRLTVLQEPVGLEPNLAGHIDNERRRFVELS